jgi:chorismate mutase/prephenate dehydratase
MRPMPSPDSSLESVRQEIDSIDDQMHDLLMRRAALVDQVRAAKANGDTVVFQPAREAEILRRLVGQHKGALPAQVVVRIWREIVSALVRLQGPFAIAVFAPRNELQRLDLVREHFSSLMPFLAMGSVGAVVSAVLDGQVQLGVLPLPEDNPDDPWWRGFGLEGPKGLQILARLPFAMMATAPAATSPALVIGRQPFQSTGEDRGYLLLETDREVSRARLAVALSLAGLKPVGFPAAASEGGGPGETHRLQLIETETWAAAGDPRLKRFQEEMGDVAVIVRPIGGYAVPLVLGEARRTPQEVNAKQ